MGGGMLDNLAGGDRAPRRSSERAPRRAVQTASEDLRYEEEPIRVRHLSLEILNFEGRAALALHRKGKADEAGRCGRRRPAEGSLFPPTPFASARGTGGSFHAGEREER